MILGVDHLGWGVAELDDPAAALAGLGYRRAFADRGLPNDASKRPYLHEHTTLHDLALYRAADGSPAIELLRHAPRVRERAGDPFPTILLAGPSTGAPAPAPAAAAIVAAWPGAGAATIDRVGGAEVLSAAIPSRSRVAAYVVATGDMPTAIRLWSTCLGARVERAGDGWSILALASPVPAWRCDLLVVARPDGVSGPRYLDDAGVTNIALLTTDIVRDRERVVGSGAADMGAVFDIEVDRRSVRACVGRTCDGDLIELLYVATARP